MCKINNHHFKVALASAGLSQSEFAKSIGVHKATLSLVLNGRGKSKRISHEVNDLITREFKKMKISVNKAA